MKLTRLYNDLWEEGVRIEELDFHPPIFTLSRGSGHHQNRNRLSPRDLTRIYKALRLRCCLGVNWVGAAIIVDLMERVAALEERIERLSRGW
ncbi:MAG TPA: hypothetical protein ENM97_01220 [Moorella mulderi]|nr:hypothetical protein [Moorella mulderi]